MPFTTGSTTAQPGTPAASKSPAQTVAVTKKNMKVIIRHALLQLQLDGVPEDQARALMQDALSSVYYKPSSQFTTPARRVAGAQLTTPARQPPSTNPGSVHRVQATPPTSQCQITTPNQGFPLPQYTRIGHFSPPIMANMTISGNGRNHNYYDRAQHILSGSSTTMSAQSTNWPFPSGRGAQAQQPANDADNDEDMGTGVETHDVLDWLAEQDDFGQDEEAVREELALL